MTISQESGPGKKKCSICIALGLGRGGHWHGMQSIKLTQFKTDKWVLMKKYRLRIVNLLLDFKHCPMTVGEKGTLNIKVNCPVLNRQIGPKTTKNLGLGRGSPLACRLQSNQPPSSKQTNGFQCVELVAPPTNVLR